MAEHRHVLAEDLNALLHEASLDSGMASPRPDSLAAMLRFLAKHEELAEPSLALGADGVMQVDWMIPDDGILALAFLDADRVHCVAIARGLTISEQVSHEEVLGKVGFLIPRRSGW